MKRNTEQVQMPATSKESEQSASSSSNTKRDIDQEDFEAFQRDLKRIRAAVSERDNDTNDSPDIKPPDHFETVIEAVRYLRLLIQNTSLLTSRGTENPFPPIVWRHHLYALFSNHTKVDTELISLSDSNQIRILNVATSTRNADIVVFLDDFCDYFSRPKKNLLIELFFTKILRPYTKTKYTLSELNQAGFGAPAIDKLINLGLLTATDASLNTRQLSFPGLGVFMRALHEGRKSLLNVIRKCKYSQILQSDLVPRSIPKCNLGIELHLYDLYGAHLVQVEPLASGTIIRVLK